MVFGVTRANNMLSFCLQCVCEVCVGHFVVWRIKVSEVGRVAEKYYSKYIYSLLW